MFILKRYNFANIRPVLASILLGFIFYKLLLITSSHFLKIDFFTVNSIEQTKAIFKKPVITASETIKNNLRFFAGGKDLGVWRQLANLAFLAIISMSALYAIVRKKNLISSFSLPIIMMATTEFVYIMSGQAASGRDTSRYLIMLAPSFIMLSPILNNSGLKSRHFIKLMFIAILTINISSLVLSTVANFRTDFPSDTSQKSKIIYLTDNGYRYGYSGMDSAIPGDYLYGKDRANLLPLACEEGLLRKNNLFFDNEVFKKHESGSEPEVPMILDGNSINNCTLDSIVKQYGEPLRKDVTTNHDTVLIYKPEYIK